MKPIRIALARSEKLIFIVNPDLQQSDSGKFYINLPQMGLSSGLYFLEISHNESTTTAKIPNGAIEQVFPYN